MSGMGATVRDACESDLDEIAAIYAFYCDKSTATFETKAPAREQLAGRFTAVRAERLPYIVIISSNDNSVLGYAYAAPYRSERIAYAHTVEISIYVRSDTIRGGLGNKLMDRLLEDLRRCTRDPAPREAIAVVAEDEVGLGRGVDQFYTNQGFECVGRLKDVGYKFDRYISVSFWQKHLA